MALHVSGKVHPSRPIGLKSKVAAEGFEPSLDDVQGRASAELGYAAMCKGHRNSRVLAPNLSPAVSLFQGIDAPPDTTNSVLLYSVVQSTTHAFI